MNVFKKKRIIIFLENSENRLLVVWLLTVLSYCIVISFTRNFTVMLFSYFFLYFIYSKLYNYILNKIKSSFNDNDYVD